MLVVIEAVSDDKLVSDIESDKVHCELRGARLVLPKQYTNANAERLGVRAQLLADGVEGPARIENIVDDQHMAVEPVLVVLRHRRARRELGGAPR